MLLEFPAATGATAAATSAHVAASGPTINCREALNQAQATRGKMPAHNPTSGRKPTSWA